MANRNVTDDYVVVSSIQLADGWREMLHECPRCGAVVRASRVELHDQWHKGLAS